MQPSRTATVCEVDRARKRAASRKRAQNLGYRTNRWRLITRKRTHLTATCSCEACSAFTRVAARTLARSPICDQLHRRLQPFRHLHDCSGCFRLERSPGGTCTHWKAPPSHGAHVKRTFRITVMDVTSRRGKRRFTSVLTTRVTIIPWPQSWPLGRKLPSFKATTRLLRGRARARLRFSTTDGGAGTLLPIVALQPKASCPLLERANRAQEVDFAELRPINIREVEFAMNALP